MHRNTLSIPVKNKKALVRAWFRFLVLHNKTRKFEGNFVEPTMNTMLY